MRDSLPCRWEPGWGAAVFLSLSSSGIVVGRYNCGGFLGERLMS